MPRRSGTASHCKGPIYTPVGADPGCVVLPFETFPPATLRVPPHLHGDDLRLGLLAREWPGVVTAAGARARLQQRSLRKPPGTMALLHLLVGQPGRVSALLDNMWVPPPEKASPGTACREPGGRWTGLVSTLSSPHRTTARALPITYVDAMGPAGDTGGASARVLPIGSWHRGSCLAPCRPRAWRSLWPLPDRGSRGAG